MRFLRFYILCAVLICLAIHAEDQSVKVTGIILDAQQTPVADAEIATQWGPLAPGEQVQPLVISTKSDAQGNFQLTIPHSYIFGSQIIVIAYTADRKQSGLIETPALNTTTPVRLQLGPTRKVHYKIVAPSPIGPKQTPGHLYTKSGVPIESLWGSEGVLTIPSGDYQLGASTPDTKVIKRNFTVSDKDLTLIPIYLAPSIIAQHMGKQPPLLNTMQDMDHRPFNIEPFHGHWTLLYFWESWCIPCINDGLPKLITFANTHKADQAKFRIIAIHTVLSDEKITWKDFHSKTSTFEKTLWHAVPSFPVVFDDSKAAAATWGIRIWPTAVLIDPKGKVVPHGNLEMLEAAIKK